MKKTTLFCTLMFICFVSSVFSQARKELNFGLIGVNYEIPVHTDITIAPGASTNFDLNWITLHVKANYYFDNLFELTDESWDVYGGAGAGYAIYNGNGNDDSGIDIGLHVGGRWFWNDTWGIYLELGGGSTQGATGGLGLTMKL
jgi:hypothetical protein